MPSVINTRHHTSRYVALCALAICFCIAGCGSDESDEKSKRSRFPKELVKEKNPYPTIVGYGDDLPTVLEKATADLEEGKLSEYLTHMLPVSELKVHDIARLEQRLKNTPNAVSQIIKDLEEMADSEPELQENGSVAAYKISTSIRTRSSNRTVKLQKTGDHWRLYDNLSALQKSYSQLRK